MGTFPYFKQLNLKLIPDENALDFNIFSDQWHSLCPE